MHKSIAPTTIGTTIAIILPDETPPFPSVVRPGGGASADGVGVGGGGGGMVAVTL